MTNRKQMTIETLFENYQSILKETLKVLPVGYIPAHTYENIPSIVEGYVKQNVELYKECEELQKLKGRIHENYVYFAGFGADANADTEEQLNFLFRSKLDTADAKSVGREKFHRCEKALEENERLIDACSISNMELETLQGEIEMTYRYYAGFGAKKDLATTEMLNHILRTVPNYKPTKEEHDLEDMKRHCDHYIKALGEITKKNRKADTCRMIALKALGELNDADYQPELLIEENLKLKIELEDLKTKMMQKELDKVFKPENKRTCNSTELIETYENNPITHCKHCGEYIGYHHWEFCKGNGTSVE